MKKIAFICAPISFILLLYANFSSVDNTQPKFGEVSSAVDQVSVDNTTVGYRGLPERIAKVFPPIDPSRRKYKEWNIQTVAELHTCVALDNCGPNQQKVALLAAHWFEEAVVRGWRGGEGVWGVSVYKHLKAMGYTTLFANSFEEALEQYQMFPDLIKVVIRQLPGECHNDPNCVKGPTNPKGIPAWKIFDFEYFATDGKHFQASMMGGKWILAPNPSGEKVIQFIGYSIEDDCTQTTPLPFTEREDRVWMLMKQLTYVYDHVFAWNRTFFAHAAHDLNLTFTGAWQIDQYYQWNPEEKGILTDIEDRANGVVNLGKLGPEEFITAIRKSKVMIGVGNPWWSPSPYHALCQGVPFLNPILRWNHDDPWNKAHWYTQHPTLQRFDPPYVYNVHAGDYEGFVNAIRKASQTEIPRFIPDYMTELSVRERVRHLMEHDWLTDAAALLEERKAKAEAGEKVYLFEL